LKYGYFSHHFPFTNGTKTGSMTDKRPPIYRSFGSVAYEQYTEKETKKGTNKKQEYMELNMNGYEHMEV